MILQSLLQLVQRQKAVSVNKATTTNLSSPVISSPSALIPPPSGSKSGGNTLAYEPKVGYIMDVAVRLPLILPPPARSPRNVRLGPEPFEPLELLRFVSGCPVGQPVEAAPSSAAPLAPLAPAALVDVSHSSCDSLCGPLR